MDLGNPGFQCAWIGVSFNGYNTGNNTRIDTFTQETY